MKIEKLENFQSYIDMMGKAGKKEIKLLELGAVLQYLAKEGKKYGEEAKRDYIIPLNSADQVAFIDHSVFLDNIEFVEKIAKFNVSFLDLFELEKIFKFRQKIFAIIE